MCATHGSRDARALWRSCKITADDRLRHRSAAVDREVELGHAGLAARTRRDIGTQPSERIADHLPARLLRQITWRDRLHLLARRTRFSCAPRDRGRRLIDGGHSLARLACRLSRPPAAAAPPRAAVPSPRGVSPAARSRRSLAPAAARSKRPCRAASTRSLDRARPRRAARASRARSAQPSCSARRLLPRNLARRDARRLRLCRHRGEHRGHRLCALLLRGRAADATSRCRARAAASSCDPRSRRRTPPRATNASSARSICGSGGGLSTARGVGSSRSGAGAGTVGRASCSPALVRAA